MTESLFCVLRHESFELRFRFLVLEVSVSSTAEDAGEFGPGIGRAHVDDPHRINAGPRRIDAEEARGLAILNAPPEFLFRGQQEVLIEGVRGQLDLDPFATTGNDRENRFPSIGDPHVVLDLGYMLLGRGLFRERPGQHEFGLKDRARALDDAVQRGGHPADHGMANPALDIFDDLPGRALVPVSIEGLGRHPKLDY